MEHIYRSQIVGAHFRPPAKAVLEHLRRGVELVLEPEPGNPYDEFAVRVLVHPHKIEDEQVDALRDACANMGQDWDEILAAGEPIHLGYCISENNKKLGAWTPNTIIGQAIRQPNWSARLDFDEAGVAFVRVEVEEGEADGES